MFFEDTKEKLVVKNLLEEHDYQEKVRHMKFKTRIEWFIDNKFKMSQNEKWDAFYDIAEDYAIDINKLLNTINKRIREKGKSLYMKGK